MCCHGRSYYDYGYNSRDYGYGHRRRHHGGPIRTLVRLAIPLITEKLAGNSNNQVEKPAAAPTLAPQTSGRTPAPAAVDARGPPPAYDDHKAKEEEFDGLEKRMSETYIAPPMQQQQPRGSLPAVGARDYQPLQQTRSLDATAPRAAPGFSDGSSRWATRLQRKEERLREKLAKKAEKYARKERRDTERGYY